MPNEQNGYNPLAGNVLGNGGNEKVEIAAPVITYPQQDYPMRQPPQKPFTRFRVFYKPPLEVSISSKYEVMTSGFTGRKYPTYSVFGNVGARDINGSGGKGDYTSIMLTSEDWYRWILVMGEILARVKSIYTDNRISDDIGSDDFKIANFKGEVLQMIPVMGKIDDAYVPAVRFVINDPSKCVDIPLIDVKSMHNVLGKIDIMTIGALFATMGDRE